MVSEFFPVQPVSPLTIKVSEPTAFFVHPSPFHSPRAPGFLTRSPVIDLPPLGPQGSPAARSPSDLPPPQHGLCFPPGVVPPPPHSSPVGGRLGLEAFHPTWRALGSSPWVMRTISHGLEVELVEEPVQYWIPPETISGADLKTLEAELDSNLEKGSVEPVPSEELNQDAFFSSQFTVPKGDTGTFRQVSNLRALNQFVQPRHFKMEGLPSIPTLLRRGDFLTKLDIKDAFFHVPIASEHRDLFRFVWKGRQYRFRAMPFGLSSAPRVFTKLLKPVVGFLRSKLMIRCVIYLDDLLIIAGTLEESLRATQEAVNLLHSLGFTINWAKSQLTPSHTAEFLGFELDAMTMEVRVPASKISALRKEIAHTLSLHRRGRLFSPRTLAALVGKLQACHAGYEWAPLQVRSLRACYLASMRHWDAQVISLSSLAVQDLEAFRDDLATWNGRSILKPLPTRVLVTDASRSGWGGYLHLPGDPSTILEQTWGFWKPGESARSSNWREATATQLCLRSFLPHLKGSSLLVHSDNQSNVAALTRKGSSVPTLNAIAQETLLLCRQHRIFLAAQHLPGDRNTQADFLSRIQRDPSDWKLNPTLFRRLCRLWFTPTIDLFATMSNCQTARFYSYRPDPAALAQDAFLQDWTLDRPYGNPPFNQMGRVLEQAARQRVPELILVSPVWTSAPWWPVLLAMLVDRPRLLPRTNSTYLPGHLGSSVGIGPPSWESAAFLLSGDEQRQREFRERLSPSLRGTLLGPRPDQLTTDTGPSSSATSDLWSLFLPL